MRDVISLVHERDRLLLPGLRALLEIPSPRRVLLRSALENIFSFYLSSRLYQELICWRLLPGDSFHLRYSYSYAEDQGYIHKISSWRRIISRNPVRMLPGPVISPHQALPFLLGVTSGYQIDIQVKSNEGNKHSGPHEFIPCIDLYPVIGLDRYKRKYTVQQVHGKPG